MDEIKDKKQEPNQVEDVLTTIQCPHCGGWVEVIMLNCRIFRHGQFKTTSQQIDPHASKDQCDEYVQKGLIYGCGKPFLVTQEPSGDFVTTVCDYI